MSTHTGEGHHTRHAIRGSISASTDARLRAGHRLTSATAYLSAIPHPRKKGPMAALTTFSPTLSLDTPARLRRRAWCLRRRRIVDHMDRHQLGRCIGAHHAGHRPLAYLPSPVEEQAPAHPVPVRHRRHRCTRPQHFLDQQQLLLQRPTATPCHDADDLTHSTSGTDLTPRLKGGNGRSRHPTATQISRSACRAARQPTVDAYGGIH